jgi:capsular polysaccharide export protein
MNRPTKPLEYNFTAGPPEAKVTSLPRVRVRQRRHFLFVSAPFGPFCGDLARALEQKGAFCTRVILNGGDWLDWTASGRGLRSGAYFLGGLEDWSSWLDRLIDRVGVTDVVTYGDSSPYSVSALTRAKALGLRAHVLEQGYFRPDWVTVESGGVNANSTLPADPKWYLQQAETAPETQPHAVGRTTPSAVGRIVRYHVAVYAAAPLFRRYRAPYHDPAAKQALGHAGRYLLQVFRGSRDRQAYEEALSSTGPIFLALLQRPGDSQLWRHSDFGTVEAFVAHVLPSFAAHAPRDARLIFKPHPLDPGLEPHADVIARVAQQLGVADRVRYIDHGKLHEILPRIRGTICVNSTAGLAAIEFGRPSIVLGRAIYDMPGMTHQAGLDSFWRAPEPPCAELYAAFRRVVLARTQVNGAYATPRGRAFAVSGVAERLLQPVRVGEPAIVLDLKANVLGR